MIISHKYRYLFVELPLTGSTAVHRELCDLYEGQAIIRKHATYREFLRQATEVEKRYFVFSSIRNPLDVAVSTYFKQKTNHRNQFTTASKLRKKGGSVTTKALKRHRYLELTGADFATYFLKYYRLPYDNWSRLNHRSFDFIIRFEQLQQDFDEALRLTGITPVRDLPAKNQTKLKTREFASYYPANTHNRARKVFGPFMKRWDYHFPDDWGEMSTPWFSDLGFNLLGIGRRAYWQYVKHHPFFLTLQGMPEKENRQFGI